MTDKENSKKDLKGLGVVSSGFLRYLFRSGKHADIPKNNARQFKFVRDGEKINDKRIEEKIKSGRVTDRHNKTFNLIRDLKDGQEIELREAPFEKVTQRSEHEAFGLRNTVGTVDFETGAHLKAKRKGNIIRIDGVAEKGFEDIYDFKDETLQLMGKPYKIRSRWEQPFSATLIVEKDKIKSSHFQWGKDE